ncbi:phenylalanine--tRNA ligase subunit beta [Ectothiorhodospira lacustris]|uniref:phenylalanine--tRNA ligase subunit beta n=1 Tax=Ectothiorhodospira lacustris TaxID=2899127 RepID=UPI001EE8C9AE|nr:phenylalanine--tRNA ligase subunit beta [Ectothiorhodospira lacustris]MCG5510286.1 phenylalanine--tRNA ligase subunit beta [Ectothiorhodospira lacustris]MCG5521847.1 phenylalanine--tRNA ligase subunit beta [Ectothiorhodospira lacustris]
MKISNQWLGQWVDHGLAVDALGHRLTMAGLELDAVTTVAPDFTGVVVAHVIAVEPHPDADKLRVCQVDDGSGEPVQVVCGAPNVQVGMRAPFARVGAVLPGDFKIKKAKLRGVPSFGMLCSARELGLSEAHEGLMSLPDEPAAGTDVRVLLGLDDQVLEVDLTPNRADCLSMAGVAREVATLTGRPLQVLEVPAVSVACEDVFPVRLEAPADCPRYAGRVIRGVNPAAPTPLWMQERLRRAGIRSLGPLVDVTNYVMLELGQPMHAFDLSVLDGAIVVRRARDGETLVLLDGQELKLGADDLVIADEGKLLALAGIMGGEASGVTDDTRDVFLESAHFVPMAVAGRARHHGLHTESSHRFERGVDPALPLRALERATQLLCEIAGGTPGPANVAEEASQVPVCAPITLRPARVSRLLGLALPPARMREILVALGCEVSGMGEAWQVAVPSFRFDLAIEEDLVEEIARVHGYDDLPSELPLVRPGITWLDEARVDPRRLRSRLCDLGYLEAITFSFVDEALEAGFSPDTRPLRLANPLSSELAVMRTTLWPGLVKAALHNLHRQQARVRLFEVGLRFVPQDNGLKQEKVISGLICGALFPAQWGQAERPVDFFDIKGDVESLLALAGLDRRVSWRAGRHPALHPGQCAELCLDGESLGWVGALNPALEAGLDLETPVFLFELSLEKVCRGRLPGFREQSRFPAIRRDLALLVDTALPAARVVEVIESAGHEALRGVNLFDVYTGRGVPEGRKSLALGLILQDLSSTLTDEKVDEMIHDIVTKLQEEVGATLRA